MSAGNGALLILAVDSLEHNARHEVPRRTSRNRRVAHHLHGPLQDNSYTIHFMQTCLSPLLTRRINTAAASFRACNMRRAVRHIWELDGLRRATLFRAPFQAADYSSSRGDGQNRNRLF